MLYDVFLHEIGHLQVVDEKAKSIRRRFAHETRAEEFAEHWRRKLWSRPFDHPDPVHSPPSPEEMKAVRNDWSAAHGDYKKALLCKHRKQHGEAVTLLTRAIERYPSHSIALERLGVLTYGGRGTTQSCTRSIELLSAAVRLDPTLWYATLFLALALGRENRESEARRYFERAIRIDPHPSIAMATYADSLADWGYFAEAEGLFQEAIKRDPECALAVRDYGRSLIRDHNPNAQTNFARAIELFERAVALNPRNAESHYRLGNALACVEGETQRAIAHLQRALKINPAHANAADDLAEIEAELKSFPGKVLMA
jgi:tetratricopeptide (TPR) repeat protein